MRRFRIVSHDLTADRVRLRGAEFHHLRHVLRLDVGAHIALYDECGATYHGTIVHIASEYAEIAVTRATLATQDSFQLTLAQSILKGSKMDLVVEKATELGVHSIIPFHSTHSVARIPDTKLRDRVQRWQRVAQAGAKQSGSLPPEIHTPLSFPDVLHAAPQSSGKIIFSAQEESQPLGAFAHTTPRLVSLSILIGPEGGFASEEIARAQAAGFTSVSLGPSILRAETASITAVALCQFLWRSIEFPPLP